MERGYAALQVMENHIKTENISPSRPKLTVADIAVYDYTPSPTAAIHLATFPAIRGLAEEGRRQTLASIPMDLAARAAECGRRSAGVAARP